MTAAIIKLKTAKRKKDEEPQSPEVTPEVRVCQWFAKCLDAKHGSREATEAWDNALDALQEGGYIE